MAARLGRAAFYAPMKPPDHPNPSGDRRIARLTLKALERAGFEVALASRLRTRDGAGDAAAQAALAEAAAREVERLLSEGARPDVWVTYHCYWKAPDLIGPAVARALAIPYVAIEGIRAPKRLAGPWAAFAAAAEAALDAAAVVFWLTRRDLPALEAARPPGQRLLHLPPFTALGEPAARPVAADGPVTLLAVGMMRAPDKLASFRALAAALRLLPQQGWRLVVVGDGQAREAVWEAFAGLEDRLAWRGRIDDRAALHAEYAAADLVVWPGVNEGFGMTYLEAQAMGRAVVAEDRPGVRDVLAPDCPRTPPDDPAAFAAAIAGFMADRAALARAGRAARAHMGAHHGIDAAAATLRAALAPLVAAR